MLSARQTQPESAGPHGPHLIVALRKATAEVHAAIEELPLMRRLTSPSVTLEDYIDYLQVIAGIYASLEAVLFEARQAGLSERLGLQPKLPALMRDLNALGISVPPPPPSTAAAAIDHYHPSGVSALVGGLYVLEGATLGGRTIARHLRRVLGSQAGDMRFLDFHGEQISGAWKRFSRGIDELRDEGILDPDETIHGALTAFQHVYHRLEQADTEADTVRR